MRLVPFAAVEVLQEFRVFVAARLPQPEDCLVPDLAVHVGPAGVAAQDGAGGGRIALRQGKDGPHLDLGVGAGAQDRVDRRCGTGTVSLSQPEDRLLAHLGVGIAASGVEQHRLGASGLLLGEQEHGAAAEAGRRRCPAVP